MSRTHSRSTVEAVMLLGRLIRLARKRRRWTAAELAERMGVTPVTLRRIETGDPGCSVGLVFEAAALTGVPLFGRDRPALARELQHAAELLAVLPERIRHTEKELNDDF